MQSIWHNWENSPFPGVGVSDTAPRTPLLIYAISSLTSKRGEPLEEESSRGDLHELEHNLPPPWGEVLAEHRG